MPLITADWLTALGTIGAVVVALFLAFLGNLLRKYRKPKLEIEFDNKEPFCRHTHISNLPNQPEGYFLRLRVRNTGKSIARDCEGKLVRILDADTREERTNFDPTNLHWTGPERKNTISIHKTAYEYLDVVFVQEHISKIFVYTNEEQLRGFPFDLPWGNCILDIVLFGKNTEPVEKFFKLEVGKFEDGYDKITMKETNARIKKTDSEAHGGISSDTSIPSSNSSAKANDETIEGNKDALLFFSGIIIAIFGSVFVSSLFEIAQSTLAKEASSAIVFWAVVFLFSSIFLWQYSKSIFKRIGIKKELWIFNWATLCFIILGVFAIVLAVLGIA